MAYPSVIFEDNHSFDELMSNLKDLNQERTALQSMIDIEEMEKYKLEDEVSTTWKKLVALTNSLDRKQAVRTEFDRAIRQGETTIESLVETSKGIVEILKSKFYLLAEDDIMSSEVAEPKNFRFQPVQPRSDDFKQSLFHVISL